jgi:TetR/AcrR family transcriptional repressor of lmrAB and yxaGH operons
MSEDTTRKRLVQTAALLFRQKGYNGVGLAEILAAADAPKGSLYHHFPNGKADLARAAAEWTSSGMLRIIDDAFADKTDWRDGVAHFVGKLAKLFDILEHRDSCPIKAMLFDGPDDTMFRDVSDQIFRAWAARLQGHAERLGLPEAEAHEQAETLLIAVEGAWTLARARRDSGVLRKIPQRMFA